MKTYKDLLDELHEEGEPSSSVSGGGVDNPDGKKLKKKPLKRKCKDDENCDDNDNEDNEK